MRPSYNVIADLNGTDDITEQIVVVSGHLDSWDLGTGAIDDGAGVVIAMEAAEILEKLHLATQTYAASDSPGWTKKTAVPAAKPTPGIIPPNFPVVWLRSKAIPGQRTRWDSMSG